MLIRTAVCTARFYIFGFFFGASLTDFLLCGVAYWQMNAEVTRTQRTARIENLGNRALAENWKTCSAMV